VLTFTVCFRQSNQQSDYSADIDCADITPHDVRLYALLLRSCFDHPNSVSPICSAIQRTVTLPSFFSTATSNSSAYVPLRKAGVRQDKNLQCHTFNIKQQYHQPDVLLAHLMSSPWHNISSLNRRFNCVHSLTLKS
jgi:hypothetical protein